MIAWAFLIIIALIAMDRAWRYRRLLAAVRHHHGLKGHERCWIEDERLYQAAGLRRRCHEYEDGQYRS